MRFAWREIRFQGVGDLRCDLALNSQNILKVTIITFRPKMPIGACIDQLHIHPNFIASSLHRTLENCGNAELLRDCLQVGRLALILRRRGPRNDFEIPDGRQLRQNLILDPLSEIYVFLFIAQIFKGQYRHRFVDLARRGAWQEKKSRRDRNYRSGGDEENNVAATMSPRNFWGGLNSLRRHVVSPGKDERHRKTDQQKHDHKTQRPIRQFPCRKNRRTNLNDERRSYDIRSRDAIDFPPLQLREEAAHMR